MPVWSCFTTLIFQCIEALRQLSAFSMTSENTAMLTLVSVLYTPNLIPEELLLSAPQNTDTKNYQKLWQDWVFIIWCLYFTNQLWKKDNWDSGNKRWFIHPHVSGQDSYCKIIYCLILLKRKKREKKTKNVKTELTNVSFETNVTLT